MDRRIKAILVANNINDLASVELVDYSDGILEIVKNNATQYISLEGRVYEEDIEEQLDEIKRDAFEIKTQDEKVETIIDETKKDGVKVTVIPKEYKGEAIFEEKKDEFDEMFESEVKVEENIDDFNIDLDDNFNFDDVKFEKKEKPKRVKKLTTTRKRKKKTDEDDDYINLL